MRRSDHITLFVFRRFDSNPVELDIDVVRQLLAAKPQRIESEGGGVTYIYSLDGHEFAPRPAPALQADGKVAP